MNLKKALFSTNTILYICIICCIVWVIIALLALGGMFLLPSCVFGPPPKIPYAEFPFKLVYKVNGETLTVEDVLIGEFGKNYYHMGWGKVQRTWKSRLRSGKKYISLYLDEEKEIFYQPTEYTGYIETFMGEDTGCDVDMYINYPTLLYIKKGKNIRSIYLEELNQTYNIQVVYWEIAPPIENTFFVNSYWKSTGDGAVEKDWFEYIVSGGQLVSGGRFS